MKVLLIIPLSKRKFKTFLFARKPPHVIQKQIHAAEYLKQELESSVSGHYHGIDTPLHSLVYLYINSIASETVAKKHLKYCLKL